MTFNSGSTQCVVVSSDAAVDSSVVDQPVRVDGHGAVGCVDHCWELIEPATMSEQDCEWVGPRRSHSDVSGPSNTLLPWWWLGEVEFDSVDGDVSSVPAEPERQGHHRLRVFEVDAAGSYQCRTGNGDWRPGVDDAYPEVILTSGRDTHNGSQYPGAVRERTFVQIEVRVPPGDHANDDGSAESSEDRLVECWNPAHQNLAAAVREEGVLKLFFGVRDGDDGVVDVVERDPFASVGVNVAVH